ncbi:uncharacterized protein LOC135493353 isoform X2 [Lineus longissimus]|uniref:uncharacterized protein LOC135493353 isoform X2 n=1 Tax=Lineus longissimus TaxID=88925 RepID=UPI002B4EC377
MPRANGKPGDPPSRTGQDDDNVSYTSGSSYSYTASESSGISGDERPQKHEVNGADEKDTDVTSSEIRPEQAVHSESPPKQTEWVHDVREDYNMQDVGRRVVPVTVKEPEKDEADKRSWLESDSDASFVAGDLSSSDNESVGGPEVVLGPPAVQSVAIESDPEPQLAPRQRAPSPPRERSPSQDLDRATNGLSPKEDKDEQEIQATQIISVSAAAPNDRQESVGLGTITEESQSKYTSPSEGSAGEIRSQGEKSVPKESRVFQQNIPVNEPIHENPAQPKSSFPVDDTQSQPVAEPKKNPFFKKSSLLSSTVIADQSRLFDIYYQNLEEEPDRPVAIPLPSQSREQAAPPRRDEPSGGKTGNVEYVWEAEECGANMVVSAETPKECHRKRAIQATDAVRGKFDLIGGVHVFQFTFNDKPFGSHCSIGVCLEDAELSREGYGPVIGKDEFGWAWDLPSRMLVHDNQNCGAYPRVNPEQFIHNKILMVLNLEEGKMGFMMEGVDLGPAFEGLPTDEPLYPAVTIVYGNAGVTVDLLQSSDKRFTLTPGGVPPLRPAERPATPSTSGENALSLEDADLTDTSDEENAKEDAASHKERPQIEREKTDSFTAMMNMVSAKDEMTLLRAFDKNSVNGFGLTVVPNDPFTCRQRLLPTPVSTKDYPSIGSTIPLDTGVHMWHVQLRREYNANIKISDGEDIESVFGSLSPCLYVGVVNEKYKRQNVPDSTGLDENSWAWNPIQERLFHADKSKQYPQTKPDNPKWNKAQTESGINLFRGIRVTLDMVQGILCYSYHDGHAWKNLGVAWNDLKGEKLYPHVWLHNAKFPVTMRYLAGNKELMDVAVDIEEATKVKNASFMMAPSFDPRVLPMYRTPEEISQYFAWNPKDCSAGITFRPTSVRQKANNFKICERESSVPPTQQDVVRCQSGFRSGVHVWLITFDSDVIQENDQYILGFGTKRAVATPITNATRLRSAVPSVVGGDFYSWGWDLKYHLLYHGEETRGEYPLLEPDFEWSDYSHYKLTLNCQSGTIHCDAYSKTEPQDCHRLGVMFNDLPKNVELFPMVGYVKGSSPVMIEYIATSDTGFERSRGGDRRTSSATCTVL